jgi:hypothetical protein
MDDERLDELREGLRRRADRADVSLARLERVRPEAPHRRRTVGRTVAAVVGTAAAVAVVAVVAEQAQLPGRGDRSPSDANSQVSERPGAWRTEYWHDTAVQVPADWWYGGGLMDGGPGGPYACFPQPMVSPAGERREDAGREAPGYVGRPIGLTDVCESDQIADRPPDWPYLWFDAPLSAGIEDLGDGWVRETVEVNGSRITVATDDDALRRRILGSAGGGEVCMSAVEPDADSDVFPRIDGGDVADAEAMTVCAYRARDDSGRFRVADLTYAGTVGDAAVSDYLAAVESGGAGRDQCPALDIVEAEWVVLELADSDGAVVRRDVVHLVCPGIDVGADSLRGFETVELTPALVRPWAVGGIPAVVHGPTGGKGAMLDSFIGPQG